MYLDLLDIDAAVLCSNGNGRLGALCDDDCPCALGVLLGALCDGLGDLLNILGLDVVRLSECGRLGLVADQDVNVGQDLVKRVLEELGDERCGKVEDEDLYWSALFRMGFFKT